MLKVSAKLRQEIISKSLGTTKGKQRYARRLFSQIQIPSRAIQATNVAKWFETDILDVHINVKGETDNYIVAITFYGVWESYDKKQALSPNNIKKAITIAFRSEDIYVACDCKDDRFRFAYVQTMQQYRSERPEYRPAKITNPRDSLGGCCKHTLLCLMQSFKWIDQLSKTTYQYIQRIQRSQPRLYEKFIKDKIEEIQEEVAQEEESTPMNQGIDDAGNAPIEEDINEI